MSTFFSLLSVNSTRDHVDNNTDSNNNDTSEISSSSKNSSSNNVDNNATNINSNSFNNNSNNDTINNNSTDINGITNSNEDINNLVHIHSKSYTIKCNYKVFLDNYLDGGYHVSVAHPELAESLNMKSYKIIGGYENFFLQTCESKQKQKQQPSSLTSSSSTSSVQFNRLNESSSSLNNYNHTTTASTTTTKPATYLFHYPNLCVNRYGQWMDINRVFPIDIDTCIGKSRILGVCRRVFILVHSFANLRMSVSISMHR